MRRITSDVRRQMRAIMTTRRRVSISVITTTVTYVHDISGVNGSFNRALHIHMILPVLATHVLDFADAHPMLARYGAAMA